MSIPSVEMNMGDLSPSIVATLQNSDGSIFNLTNCTVVFQLTQQDTVLFSKPAVVTNASAGIVQYNWGAGDTNHYGVCIGIFIVTLPGGAVQTFPTVGFFYVIFPLQPTTTPTVPAFTSFSEVMAHLNVQGPDQIGAYAIYGLPVSQQGIQSHVDHANKYVYSLVPGLASSDPRYVSAELAALDIACLGVLVTAVGGSLVGAYDYSLGDLHVSRAGAYAYAIKAAIDGYQRSAIMNLQNFVTVASAAEATAASEVPRYRGALMNP